MRKFVVSVVVPCKDEAGTIEEIILTLPRMEGITEVIFVDGHSTDGTWEKIERMNLVSPDKARADVVIRALTQPGVGKWDAVSYGLSKATGEILMIYDADMSVPIMDIPKFYRAVKVTPEALVIGSRFIYPQERGAMRLLNHTGNVVFSWIFSWMLKTSITDTLCGTKAFTRELYQNIWRTTGSFRSHDPYGDFTLLLGAAKLKASIVEVPIRYMARVYGETKISRFRDGIKLLVVLWHAVRDFLA